MEKGASTKNWTQEWEQAGNSHDRQLGVLTEIFEIEADPEIIALGLLADPDLVTKVSTHHRHERHANVQAILALRNG